MGVGITVHQPSVLESWALSQICMFSTRYLCHRLCVTQIFAKGQARDQLSWCLVPLPGAAGAEQIDLIEPIELRPGAPGCRGGSWWGWSCSWLGRAVGSRAERGLFGLGFVLSKSFARLISGGEHLLSLHLGHCPAQLMSRAPRLDFSSLLHEPPWAEQGLGLWGVCRRRAGLWRWGQPGKGPCWRGGWCSDVLLPTPV